ncbi:MAG TPA: PKD domain-containing protein [Puia sp.]|jgi:hypothetical protein|nr:PKD domain-containing protein [Puia sp.]
MKRTGLTLLLVWTISCFCKAQDSIPPEIRAEERGDSIQFSALLRPLRQVAGAPSAFYTYFWELGDGRFSFEKDPLYAYRDSGLYQVRLYATNNYDDGKAPPTRPRPVKIRKKPNGSGTWASHFFHGNGNIEMKINRNPRPGEDFVTLVGYRNQSPDSLGGSIVLFYNERQFGREGFALAEKRYYNGEDSSSLNTLMASLSTDKKENEALATGPARNSPWTSQAAGRGDEVAGWMPDFAAEARTMLHQLLGVYQQHTVLHFPAMASGEEKFLFMDMNTLPGMLQDTNAMVSLTAMLVPDNPGRAPEVFQLDMQVVASHDPNRMQLRSRRINYRFFSKTKALTYKVQFQNTGRGPAKKISIGIAIPRQLNTASVELKSMSPVCRWCDSAYNRQSCIDTVRSGDSLYFVFSNIYLPGLQQEGVTNKDSTEGFVEYSIRFKKKPKKIPFSTQAAIIFDKNEPVFTNKATARFIKGLSPGIMVGYSALPSQGGYSAKGPLQFGYVLAPYAPSRPFFQAEIFVGLLQQDDFSSAVVKTQQDTAIGNLKFLITGRSEKTTTQRNSFEITPLHFRYNLGNWVGVGLGAMVQVNLSEQTTVEKKVYLSDLQLPLNVSTAVSTTKSGTRWLGNWNAAPFADIQVGRVKTGPVLGLRYMRLLKGDITNRFFLYAGFKL